MPSDFNKQTFSLFNRTWSQLQVSSPSETLQAQIKQKPKSILFFIEFDFHIPEVWRSTKFVQFYMHKKLNKFYWYEYSTVKISVTYYIITIHNIINLLKFYTIHIYLIL